MDFETVYREYFGDVYRYLLRLTGSETLAEELTAETFFKALKAVDRFRGECDIRVWLCRIAKNEFCSFQKKLRRFSRGGEEELLALEDPKAGPAEQAENSERLQTARRLLHTLSEPYKEVFMWRTFGELSFKEIGRMFGKSENWACVTCWRARKMLLELSKGEEI